MTRSSFKLKYDSHAQSVAGTLGVVAGDLHLKATCTDATFQSGSALAGLALAIEKPGAFTFDYDVPARAPRFQFVATTHVATKPLKLTYTHSQKHDSTLLEGALTLAPSHKVTAKYGFSSKKAHVKYAYCHGRHTTLEPAYDFATEKWSFAVSQKITGEDSVKLMVDDFHKTVGVEWNRESKSAGPLKIVATVPVDGHGGSAKVSIEKTWKFEA